MVLIYLQPTAAQSSYVRTAGGVVSNVDMYNVAKGTWTTAAISVARSYFAATHVGNLAMFAGGVTTTGLGLKPNLNLSTES